VRAGRIPILYIAPWIDFGGTDKNTIDWFRKVDRERFAPSLITTQASPNRRLNEVAEFAEEIWVLPDLMSAEEMPAFILDFVVSREVQAVHLMNSRLGFDLLPDLTAIERAPGIVVQLHVEEADRSGYVRYVTTRYGNLVDRFSVTSEHLAAAVRDYGIPPDRIEVIYIGVDAEEEFSPQRVEPIEGLEEDRMHVLFPARIVQQKDPLLMVEVAKALRDRGVRFQIHVLGEGDLEENVKGRVGELGLEDEVRIHPPTATPQRWYAGSDAVLLTSEFEGVPAVVFEAMAMGVPVVASALPGNSELLGADYSGLIEPREWIPHYVEELARLAEDPSYRESHGQELRERAREHFSLEQMVRAHERLYEEVAPVQTDPDERKQPLPDQVRFPDRSQREGELVSVLIPHYNQARFLGDCVESVWAQTYPNVEIVIVDDCSSERDARLVLDELEEQGDVKVLRLERNGGPSRARNLGLEQCSGRYVLPFDSDNLLLPDALDVLVEQLRNASEEVGFIYPNLQFFGNREDYYEPPPYNVYTLFHGNYCDTCSLIDRGVFDAGLRYREEIVLGHEDWEFVLRLAAHGIRGEAAKAPTLLYRKWGFNRSDSVDHAHTPFDEELKEISPFAGHEEEVKSAESPALSIACLRPLINPEAVASKLAAQSSLDVELLTASEGYDDPVEALQKARQAMRGRYMLVSEDPEAAFLADPGFVEKVLRRFTSTTHPPDLIAFVDMGPKSRFSFRVLAPGELAESQAHAVAWQTAIEEHLPKGLHADPARPVPSLARLLSGSGGGVEWRHAPVSDREPAPPVSEWQPVSPPGPAATENALVPPLLPGSGGYEVPRWEEMVSWVPPIATVLVRYREPLRNHWLITTRLPPFGYAIDRHLGALRSTAFEGTERLFRVVDELMTSPRGEWQPLPDEGEELGYLELAPFPQLKALALGIHRASGQQVLVTPPDDPLLSEVDLVRHLGFVEALPAEPRFVPPGQPGLGLVGLVKSVDLENRRHRYALGALPPGQLAGELGSLAESELQASIAAWIVDGQLVTEHHSPPPRRPRPRSAARWVLEPAARWRGIATKKERTRATLRRSAVGATNLIGLASGGPTRSGRPAAWLFAEFRPNLSPLFASYHPITGDQLLSRSPGDAGELGYDPPTLLGFVRLSGPVTGHTRQSHLPLPWARRLGAVPRSG
jgi:glycosyltransferase involved in cell wall biosynthesis